MGNSVCADPQRSDKNVASQLEKIAREQGGDESLRKMIRSQLSSYSARSKVELALDNAWLQQQNIRQQRLLSSLKSEVDGLRGNREQKGMSGSERSTRGFNHNAFTANTANTANTARQGQGAGGNGGGGGGGGGGGSRSRTDMHQKRAALKMNASPRTTGSGAEAEEDRESDYEGELEGTISSSATTRMADDRLKQGHSCFENFVNLKYQEKNEEAGEQMRQAKVHTAQVIKWCELVDTDGRRSAKDKAGWKYVHARALRNMGVFYAEQVRQVGFGHV